MTQGRQMGYALVIFGLLMFAAVATSHAAKPDELQAPRTQEVNAPRTQEVNAPRTQEVNAPRTQEVNAP